MQILITHVDPSLHAKENTLYVEDGFFVDGFSHVAHARTMLDLSNLYICSGLVETHLHLDKACIMSRCTLEEGTLAEAIAQTAQAKKEFTEADVYSRAQKVIEKAIMQGTMHIRTHVEIDPNIGLTSFNAILKLKQAYAWAIDLQICVFPQEGMLNNLGTEELLCQALEQGADLIGGCPYTDSHPEQHIERIFEISQRYKVDIDFHFDFDLKTNLSNFEKVIELTQRYNMQNKVTLGHATRLSALERDALTDIALKLAQAGVNITTLPSTDLFLNGREQWALKPRGVVPIHELDVHGVCCSIASNNIGNPFTPFGDASLVRQANLYANVAQLGAAQDLKKCMGWISNSAAQLMQLTTYGLNVGCQADFIVFDAVSKEQIIAENLQPIMGFKAGKKTFQREKAVILQP